MSENSWIPMRREEIDSRTMDIIKGFIDEVPNLPVHVHKLVDIVSDFESDSLEVANAASADPGLVSKILRTVNSSYYGLSHKTDNIHFAIVLLGFTEVRKIAIQTSFSNMFKEGKGYEGYETTGLWEHSYLVSVCAETIGRTSDTKSAGELLTFGILHDIGKFVLFRLAIFMKKNKIAPYKSKDAAQLSFTSEKEEALFNINHTIVGSMLAKKWELSDRISCILEYHHHPSFRGTDSIPPEYLNDIAAVSISDAIVNHINGKECHPAPAPEYFELLGLPTSLKDCITIELKTKLEDAQDFVKALK